MALKRINSFLRYLIISLLLALVFKSVASLGRVGKLFLSGQAASTPAGPFGLAVLATDELINLAWHVRLVFLLLFRHDQLSENWIADALLLVIGVDMPIFNLIAAMTFPGFMQQKNYLAFHAFMCTIVGFIFPPAHMLVHWILSSPVYM